MTLHLTSMQRHDALLTLMQRCIYEYVMCSIPAFIQLAFIQRFINVDPTSWRCIDVDATVPEGCVSAGKYLYSLRYSVPETGTLFFRQWNVHSQGWSIWRKNNYAFCYQSEREREREREREIEREMIALVFILLLPKFYLSYFVYASSWRAIVLCSVNFALPVCLFYCFTTLVFFYNIDKKIVSSSKIYHSYVFILFKSSVFFFFFLITFTDKFPSCLFLKNGYNVDALRQNKWLLVNPV